ncbi:sigma-70 family RNA polymerase sigma factor [Paenibacillus silviterrae]|uniref:sigma-70 family RNA polymerase sigma factor n=1 Tax=Paenibacillus silviterrae TaxID=3242194 RepID=UPI002543BC91|nr:sigma-70 family RNA polymerase sigma factor [Paenibacillus chinjuensis]
MRKLDQHKYSGSLETDLVIAAAGGDAQAFAELVRSYTNAVCAIAFDILRDYFLAQDIAQECFVKAFRSLHSLRQPERFGSWLYSIALHLSIDYKRLQTRKSLLHKELGQLALRENERQAEDIIFRQEMRLDVKQALQQLDETNRTILLSFYVSEMTMPEIARMLHMSVAAVESRIRRSRKLLKEQHLSAWAGHFRKREASDELLVPVMERIVKQAGQFYIPVSDRRQSTEWFVRVLGLSLDHNGHILLPSGHCLFLIEVREDVIREHASSRQPAVVFLIENEDQFCRTLEEQGVRTVREEAPGIGQMRVFFFDPDGNRYGAFTAF